MEQIALDPEYRADDPRADSVRDDGTHQATSDLAYKRLAIVNVAFYGTPGSADWVLIDAGVPKMARQVLDAARERFSGAPPAAIILTHGHVDHVGSLEELLETWDVPVYAHELEFPYLDGRAAYPPPDKSVGGGLFPLLSGLFPRDPINISNRLRALPADGSVPHMPGWQWIHVPGHTPGQIGLWRESDRTLMAADAFITTRQESVYAVAVQAPEMHGPPMYFTQDWEASRESVRKLAALEPELVVCGHGRAMHGPQMRAALHELAENFDSVAVPQHGVYVRRPARAENGSAYPAPG